MLDMQIAVRAVDFPAGLDWLNVDSPLTLKDLRGKIILLDFWTFCCINCIHIMPELKKLEEEFPETLAVIGVHSPKYYAEAVTENVRQAVLRHHVSHPVVNDKDHTIWDSYAISAWPTISLISPDGYLIGVRPGEFEAEQLIPIIENLQNEYDRKGMISRMPLPMALETEPEKTLSFPGKVLANAESNRIFIADSSHNRILVTDMDGVIQEVVGTGELGMNDADFQHATFRFPQGMALDGDILYVADTDNHSVRMLDFDSRTVSRIAGTGHQARLSRREGLPLETDLSSPWDLALGPDGLYVAMAGNHQIWVLKDDKMRRFAGTGREALSDGTLERCALAQTSGLSLDGSLLYFADSETSSIRVADPTTDRVQTIVGMGLFDFGDIDGRGSQVRLQHCLGVAVHDGMLYVADSYNNKIKLIDPKEHTSDTFLGSGDAGLRNGKGTGAQFWEPGGVSISGGKLYIADTNNHAIRVADLGTGEVHTLEIMWE